MQFRKMWAFATILGTSGLMVLGAPPNTTNQNQGGNSANKNSDQRTAWKSGDHMLASCVAIDNQEEVALARFAEDKLGNEDAKDFAKMLIKDHTAFLGKLKQYAPEATRDGFLSHERTASGDRTQSERKERNSGKETVRTEKNPPAATQRTAAKPNLEEIGGIDPMQLHRELAEQCLANTEKMMSDKSDREFDACFIGMQIAKHAAMKTKLEVFQRHASGELKDLFAQGLKTTTKHLEQAEKLMKQLDESDSSRSKK